MTREEALQNKTRVQKEGVEAWQVTGIGTLEEATGVGKSKMALDILQFLRGLKEIKALFVVPTEEMRDYDWPAEFNTWGVSMLGVKLICYASLALEDLSDYNFIVYDEGHRITMENLSRLEVRLAAPNRPYVVCLTATIPRHAYTNEEAERYALLRLLLPVVHKTTTDQAVELGLVKDFEIKVLKFKLDDKSKNIPAGNKAKRWKQTEEDRYTYLNKLVTAAATARTQLIDGIATEQEIDKAEAFLLTQLAARANFIYNLPSKTRLAKLCLERLHKEDNRTIVFCGSIEQANDLCGEFVYHSKSTREYLDKFQNTSSSLLGTVKALNEGKNLSKPTHGLIVQVDSVMRNLIQRIGRLIRINYENLEEKATIVILVVSDTKDEDWFNKSIVDFDSKRISYHNVNPPAYVPA